MGRQYSSNNSVENMLELIRENNEENPDLHENPYEDEERILAEARAKNANQSPADSKKDDVNSSEEQSANKQSQKHTSSRKRGKDTFSWKNAVRCSIPFSPQENARIDIVTAAYSEMTGKRISKSTFIKMMVEAGIKSADREMYRLYKDGILSER